MLKDSLQSGFTLTEVLVTIVVFTLVTGAIYSINLFNQKAYREGETAAEIVQNGRVILERMTREIRQAKEIVTELPDEEVSAPEEIEFQDGHIFSISEEGAAQEGTVDTITLAATASAEEGYYEDMFIKITAGTGVGEIRKIADYDGITKVAKVEANWDTPPVTGSSYKIDSSYYYIRYYKPEGTKDIKWQIIVYYFSVDPHTYVHWNDTDEYDNPPTKLILEDKLVGQYVSNLNFWGLEVINISLTLTKYNRQIDLTTKIFGRNL